MNVSRMSGNRLVGTEHILMAILKESGCSAVGIIRDLGGNPSRIYNECAGIQTGTSMRSVGNLQPMDMKQLPTLAEVQQGYDISC